MLPEGAPSQTYHPWVRLRPWVTRAVKEAEAAVGLGPGEPPSWFTTALDAKAERSSIDVEGCTVHYRTWGEPRRPALVLIHGGGAHSGWWDHVAPLLSRQHYVIAPDLSGHGDSGRRPEYALQTWSREALAVGTAHDADARPVMVGHSICGWVAATTAVHHGADIEGIVAIDTPLRDRAPEGGRMDNRGRRPSGYRSRTEIISRFRPVPTQDEVLPFVADHIAAESVRRQDGRWFWKFDPRVFALPEHSFSATDQEPLEEMFGAMRCRTGYILCERGIVPPEMALRIESVLQLRGPFIQLAVAGHHPMLDQPLSLVATLRTLLEMWSIT